MWRDDPRGTPESFLRSRHGRDHGEARRDVRASKLLPSRRWFGTPLTPGCSRGSLGCARSIGQKTDVRAKELPLLARVRGDRCQRSGFCSAEGDGAWADQVDPIGTGNDGRMRIDAGTST